MKMKIEEEASEREREREKGNRNKVDKEDDEIGLVEGVTRDVVNGGRHTRQTTMNKE